ncbi:MAG: response regulator [Rhodospirillales bacterium]|nr:response regulator [Rhodospirillales bacterium]
MSGLAGSRILVVEDEMLIAMVVETLLGDASCEVVGPFGRLAQALKSAEQDPIDAALLDINLHGEQVFPVADALTARNIPFVFVTGYGAGGLPSRFKNSPTVTKPYRAGAVLSALTDVLSPTA